MVLKTKCKSIGLIIVLSIALGFLNSSPGYGDDSETVFFWQFQRNDATELLKPKKGLASWYGRRFHGRKTASGESYNQHAFTCASRTLPFGTLLKVTNVKNRKTAIVRVNDRGPYRKKRVLDLSYGVAKQLGILKKGVGQVEYAILYHPE